jgi:ribosomal protein RSM22 (predicted rRNA methylase)
MTTPDLMNVLYNALDEQLKVLGLTYQKPSGLSKSILETSAFFIQKKGASPWKNPGFQAAYIAHFLPMNIIRWLKVFDRIESQGFEELDSFLDFGSGPLTFKLAYYLKYQEFKPEYNFIELESIPIKIGSEIFKSIAKQLGDIKNENLSPSIKSLNLGDISPKKQSTLVLSYSLNELKDIPEKFWEFENIIILEPSTQEISRSLLEFRAQAVEKDFKPIAPCTHSGACPMLTHSKKDWCFDRTHFEIPNIAHNLYKILPFEKKHLTFSYLWLSQKETPKSQEKNLNEEIISDISKRPLRFVGDWQKEKGKEKIMICRSSEREFLSQLKKTKNPIHHNRGDQTNLDFEYEIKGNELRIK